MSQYNEQHELDGIFRRMNKIDLSESESHELLSDLKDSVEKSNKKQKFLRIAYPVFSTTAIALFVLIGGLLLMSDSSFLNKVTGDDSKEIMSVFADPTVRLTLLGDESEISEITYLGSNIYRIENDSNRFLVEVKEGDGLEVYEFKESLRDRFVYEDEGKVTPADHPFAGMIEKNERYNAEYPHQYKIPTYLPFELEDVSISSMEEEAEIFNKWYFDLLLFNRNTRDHVLLNIEYIGDTKVTVSGNNREEIRLSNGEEAVYTFNGSAQSLFWSDGDMWYSMSVPSIDGVEKYSIEELVRIANSFEPYNY